jgi:hypothetical protein
LSAANSRAAWPKKIASPTQNNDARLRKLFVCMRTPEFRKIPKQRRYYNTISVKSNDVTIRWAFRSEDNFYFSVAGL